MYRTHNCGELRLPNAGETVKLAGWVHRRRDHGGLTFIDLRDRYGIVQVVTNPDISPDAHEVLAPVRLEWVIEIEGLVKKRLAGKENPKLSTGEIEVEIQKAIILNPAKPTPFLINGKEQSDEQTRLHYRYLDLRRPRMRENLVLRHKIVKFIRDYLDDNGFLEVETPILFKTTPEGARDYLVPSRIHPGEFYALPQSPQQLKQLLMVAGVDRYFQIARCFRDEDQRGDRQPEFTQVDMEMAFADSDQIMDLITEMMKDIVAKYYPHKKLHPRAFEKIPYKTAMELYGTDKPDIRFDLLMKDITDIVSGTDFEVFQKQIQMGGIVKCLKVEQDMTKKQKHIHWCPVVI